MAQIKDLESFLDEWSGADAARQTINQTMRVLAQTGRQISRIIARGPLEGAMGAVVGDNADGDAQKALDIRANDMIIEALKPDGVVAIVGSEELDDPIRLNDTGSLCVAMDPLDGSSNIDVNVSIGTIFSILPVLESGSALDTLLQPGTAQLASGYIIYGPQTAIVFTLGQGTHVFTLDPDSGKYMLTDENIKIVEETREFAINASNLQSWFEPIGAYIGDCLYGEQGPLKKRYNMRWVASLIAETHRILSRGGIFLYPGDMRDGYEFGRLRLVYEANPISYLVEQAGGIATTGQGRILDITPTEMHQRVPFIFGSANEVATVERYCAGKAERHQSSPLFGQRGLFRN